MKEIVLAAFSIHKRNSIAYRKYKTIEGFCKGIGDVIAFLNPDYISVRIIKEQTKKENNMSKRPCETCDKKEECFIDGDYINCEKLKEWSKKATADIDFS